MIVIMKKKKDDGLISRILALQNNETVKMQKPYWKALWCLLKDEVLL